MARAFDRSAAGGGIGGNAVEYASGREDRVQCADGVVDFAVVRDLPRPAASRHFAEVARGGVVDAVVRNLCAEREQHLAEFA